MQPHEILEALSHKGYAPTLLYDDNGNWLVTDNGVQPMCGGDGTYTTFICEEKWQNNITDAVNDYLLKTEEAL